MPNKVLKRDGREEEFQLSKLKTSLEKAAKAAGYPEDRIFQVIEEVSGYVLESISDLETVDTQLMRILILSKLDEIYPEVSVAWRKYDREMKGRED
jgi:transcriptional regulator NrdR family protein